MQTTFQNYSFRLNFFSNKMLAIGTSFAQVKRDPNLEISPVYLSKF